MWHQRCSIHSYVWRCLRWPSSLTSATSPVPLSPASIDVVASVLHTKWRADRQREKKGALVPRWKSIGVEEATEWQKALKNKVGEEQMSSLRGVLFEEVPIAQADGKAFLAELQACSDTNRTPQEDRERDRDKSNWEIRDTLRSTHSVYTTMVLRQLRM